MKSRLPTLFCSLMLSASALWLQGCPSSNSPAAPAPVTVVELVTATFTYTPTATPTPGGAATATPIPPPAVINGYFTTSENTALVLSNSTLNTLVTSDPNGDPLLFIFPGSPADGTVSLTHISHTNTLTYTPNSGFYGVDSFAYYVHDQATNADSTVQTMVITVTFVATATPTSTITSTPTVTPTSTPSATPTPVPAPVLTNGTVGTTQNVELVLPNSYVASLVTLDPNGDPLSFSLGYPPTQGTLAFNADGSFTYTPNSGYLGTDSFSFEAYDETTGEYSNFGAIGINVNP